MRFVFKPRLSSAMLFGECVEERVRSVFWSEANELLSVSVCLTENHAPGQSGERQCKIEIVSRNSGRVAVFATHDDWRSAFDAALVRAACAWRKRVQSGLRAGRISKTAGGSSRLWPSTVPCGQPG